VGRENFDQESEEVQYGLFVKETVNPYGVEGLSHRHPGTLCLLASSH
jgi:hypothetical protein